MRRGMVLADRRAARMIHFEEQRVAGLDAALLHRHRVRPEVAALLLRVGDGEPDALAAHLAGVADLAAGLAVERRLVDDDEARVAGLELLDLAAVLDQSGDDALGAL